MRIGVVTEVSTRDKNAPVMSALKGRGHLVINAGMTGAEGENELTYIHTGFIGGLLLGCGCVDLVVGGCGTGQGFLNSVMQYPGVTAGVIQSPLDAWLFAQINGGNCISLVLNKEFGWAGDVNLGFVSDRFFSVERGGGYPEHRKNSQKQSIIVLRQLSDLTHLRLKEIIERMDESVLLPALSFPGVMDIVRESTPPDNEIRLACEKRLSGR